MRWLDSINDSVDMDLSKCEETVEDRGSWCQLKTCTSSRLTFIWGKMKTASWEEASQIALRDCSKVILGKGQYIRFW